MLIKLLEGLEEKKPEVTGTAGFKNTPQQESRRLCHSSKCYSQHKDLMTSAMQATEMDFRHGNCPQYSQL